MIFKSCLIASLAFTASNSMTLPDGRVVTDNVTILEPCVVRPDPMTNIFRARAWKRIQELRKWSRLG